MSKKKSKEFIELCQKYGVDPNVIPEIRSYEEACKVLKLDPKKDRDAMQRTIVICEAFRKELKFKVNYKNISQQRWWPVHKMTPTGLVFSFTSCEGWLSGSFAVVGAPFVLPTSPVAKFVGIHFLPEYSWKIKYKVK